MSEVSVPSSICVHDDFWFMDAAIRSFLPAGPVTVFVSQTAWDGTDGCWERCAEIAEAAGAEVVIGDWPDETLHRRSALAEMRRRGHRHILIPDSDEVIEPALLERLVHIAQTDLAGCVRVHMQTYFKSARYRIQPPETLAPLIMIDAQIAKHTHIREYESGRLLTLSSDFAVLHHLSYAGPDSRIARKIQSWGHRNQVVPDWYRRVWLGWTPLMRDLHPTHPHCYASTERIDIPEILSGVWDGRAVAPDPDVPEDWPSLSVVIPLFGGPAEIANCLKSLRTSSDLISEIVLVDDKSPDDALETARAVADELPIQTKILENPENLGFAATCNRGYAESSGDVVLFLNSDTLTPRAGLVRLVEALYESPTIGAAGPYTNHAGHYQAIQPTYTCLEHLDAFARDFADRTADDRQVDMLVGFCLAVKRQVIRDLGNQPFDERFGKGTFEDNDLSYRLLRSGYKLALASRAYVHHEGSKSLSRLNERPAHLLNRNRETYLSKWREDLETGFASHLAGLKGEALTFDETRRPERVRKEIRRLAKKADISLCLIVKDEQRVIADCLASTRGAFSQIVVVDTGSTDQTREIVKEFGVELYEFPWTNSFSEARNESLRHAKGRWICWIDADDTLPLATVEEMLQAAIGAPDHVHGFIVPVQFVENGMAEGTRVDHLKLFRRLPGVQFKFRIHEQVLESLREHGGEIGRLNHVVLHSGYDTSTAGQIRKRLRDAPLLALDLQEWPDHPFVLWNLGMTAHFCGDHEEAVSWLRRCVEVSGPSESHVRKAYALMGASMRELQDPQDAVDAFTEGLARVGPDPDLLYQRALTLRLLGRNEEAKQDYLAMPLDVSGWFTSIDRGILGFRRARNLAVTCNDLGQYDEAAGWWEAALADAPHHVQSAFDWFEAAMSRSDFAGAQKALGRIEAVLGDALEFWERRERWTESALGSAAAEDALAAACRACPSQPAPALCLARRLCRSGREAEAEPMLLGLASAGISEAAFYLGVSRVRRGCYEEALAFMRLARSLEPGGLQAQDQIEKLEATLGPGDPAPPEKRALLIGPCAGLLPTAAKRFSVIVVTFNSASTIERCLDSLIPTLDELDEIIVVDNASPDGTLRLVSEKLAGIPGVTVVENSANLGYAAAANQGILASSGDTIVLLNPDTEVFPGWLEQMQATLNKGYGAVGPASDNVGGDQFVGFYLGAGHRPALGDLAEVLKGARTGHIAETRALMGMCLMISRSVLNKEGLLDENCALGADDLELSWRLRRLGYRLAIATDTFVRHEGGASFGSVDSREREARISASDMALIEKLEKFYGRYQVPSSQRLFGSEIFTDALNRRRVQTEDV